MTKSLDSKLEEIEARCNAATEGPWIKEHCRFSALPHTSEGKLGSDAEFIAHARTDVPKLLAVIRKQEEIIAFCKSAISCDGTEDAPIVVRQIEKRQAELLKLMGDE